MSTLLIAADSGQTLYATFYNDSGQPYYATGSAYEAFNASHWTGYAVALTEQGTSGIYTVAVPSGALGSAYTAVARVQAGGSAAQSDVILGGASLVTRLDLTQAVPNSNTAQTVGDALLAARTQGFGKWSLSGTTLNLYAADNSTVVKTLTLDSSTTPSSRS